LVKDYISLGGDKSPENFERYNNYLPILKAVFASKILENSKQLTLKII